MASRTPPKYDLVGGRLCLDFCNTTSDRRGYPEERLETYADVVGWGWRAGILNTEEAARLSRLGSRGPAEGPGVGGGGPRLRGGGSERGRVGEGGKTRGVP